MHMHSTTWNSAINASLNPETELGVLEIHMVGCCNEHGTIYAISSDFGDRMTTQSMGLMFLLSEHF